MPQMSHSSDWRGKTSQDFSICFDKISPDLNTLPQYSHSNLTFSHVFRWFLIEVLKKVSPHRWQISVFLVASWTTLIWKASFFIFKNECWHLPHWYIFSTVGSYSSCAAWICFFKLVMLVYLKKILHSALKFEKKCNFKSTKTHFLQFQ